MMRYWGTGDREVDHGRWIMDDGRCLPADAKASAMAGGDHGGNTSDFRIT